MANWRAKPASTTATALQKWQVIIAGPDIFLSHNIFIKFLGEETR